MTKLRLGAPLATTCAAVMLSLAFVSAQAPVPQAAAQRGRANQGSTHDTTPQATRQAAKAPQEATLTGCVVRDAANGGKPTIASNGISYKLTGKGNQDFSQYLGKRVEATGMLQSGSSPQRATSGRTDEIGVPKDQTAVGGQSDVPATGTSRDNTVPATEAAGASHESIPLATDKGGTTADMTGRLHVRTIKTVSGSCL